MFHTAKYLFSYFEGSKPFESLLGKVFACKLNIIGDKQHSCLTPVPNFTFLVSPWSHHAITLWFMYNFLINLLSRQSLPVHIWIYNNMVQFCQSMRQAHFLIYVQSSPWCYSQHPTCIPSSFSSYESKLIFYKYILNIPVQYSSKYSPYYLCCIYHGTDCMLVAGFCSVRFLL